MPAFDPLTYRYASRRNVVYAKNAVACTSVPLGAQIGLDVMKSGGNAVDAAVAMAAAMPLLEPTGNGLGSDCFALVWIERDKRLYGLNASGVAPMVLSAEKVRAMGYTEMPKAGWLPTMVPGAPAGWAELNRRFGTKPLAELFAPAISYAEEGYPVPVNIARQWERDSRRIAKAMAENAAPHEYWWQSFMKPDGTPYRAGELFRLPDYAATLRSLAATEEDSVYRLYYDFEQPLSRLQGHQILAINRGEKEKMLSATVLLDRELALPLLRRAVVKPGSAAMEFVKAAAEDAYDRLIYPSLEREMRAALTDKASEGAIKMFALNLKPLLMQPPVKGHVTMGLDPGYAHGCKVAVIDATGKVLDTTVVYPTYGERQKNEAITKLAQLVKKHGVEHIAIGNGTASRETEQMTVELIHRVGGGLSYMIVSEAGASVYSASKLAAEEFPQFDVNLRSAVSIARRLQDPLAELVKIDPKAIGVGQYQHDMPQKELDASLNAVVEDCVNAVGVDLNTASPSLLTRVAGLNGTIAKNIVAFREENGVFTTRRQLLKVAKLGPKAFEQCAGFLRVPESKNVLDNTGVHPESYDAAKWLLELLGATPKDARDLPARLNAYGAEKAAEALGVGVPTLRDIAKELSKPGRDPRDELPAPILRTDVLDIKDLKPGMVLTGTVRNVIDFGVFVDIGVHQDGLVHISQVCNKFIKHPSEAVAVGDVVKVVVLDVDEKKHRISLSMKQVPEE